MSKEGNNSFGREAFKGFSAKFLTYLFGFGATTFFARELGPKVFGGYFLLLSIVEFTNRLPQGIGGAAQKRIAEVGTPDDELLGVVIGTTGVLGLVATVTAYLGRDQLASYTGLSNAATLAVPLLVVMSLYLPLMFLLSGKGRFGDKEWVGLTRDVLERPAQFAFVTLGLGATGMVFGRIGASVVCLPLLLYLLKVRPSLPSRETVSYVWKFAKPNIASNVVGKAYTRFDVFLLGFVGATAAVGFYEAALLLTRLGALISKVMMDGLLSKVSTLDSQGRRIDRSVSTTLSYTSVIAVPAFVLALVLGTPMVRTIYGSDFVTAVPFVLGLAFYRIVQVQRETVENALKGLNRPECVYKISSIALALNFVVGVSLLVVHGPYGVVVGTILAELLRWGLLHRAIASEGHSVSKIPTPLRIQAVSGVLMGGAVWAAATVVPHPYTVPDLLGLTLFGGVVYAAGIVATDETASRVLRTFFTDARTQLGDAVPL